MRTFSRKFTLYAAGLTLVAVIITIVGCEGRIGRDENMQILRRIPNEKMTIFSARPGEIFKSQFLQSLPMKSDKKDELKLGGQKIRDIMGIDPLTDIDRIVITSKDLKDFVKTWSIIIQGNMKEFFLDTLLIKKDVRDSMLTILDFNVHYITIPEKTDSLKLFIHFDSNEIILTANQESMNRMLELKKGRGRRLAHNTSFVRRLRNLKYNDHVWCVLPVEGLMEDVLKKVHKKMPDFQMDILNIKSIQGGLYINNELGLSLQAYCVDGELAGLLKDTINGFLAMGKLSVGVFPPIRKMLDNIEIVKKGELLEVNMILPIEDIRSLRTLSSLNSLMRKN